MKSKVVKRLLSVFLAVVMVFTMMPAYSFSAFAADEGISSQADEAKSKAAQSAGKIPHSAEMMALDNAMAAYEAKIDGNIYTNMSAAYEQYQLAYKYYASKSLPSNSTDSGVTLHADNLNAAIDAMQLWKGNKFDYQASKSFDADTAYDNNAELLNPYYSSLAWAQEAVKNQSYTLEVENCYVRLFTPSVVAVYNTDEEIIIPAILAWQGTWKGVSAKTRSVSAFYVTDASHDVQVREPWLDFQDTANSWALGSLDYAFAAHSIKNGYTKMGSAGNVAGMTNEHTVAVKPPVGGGNARMAVSTIGIKPTFSANEYSKKYVDVNFTQITGENAPSNSGSQNASLNYYVINYKKFIDALYDVNKAYDVSLYKWGGLSNVFELLDTITAFDFTQSEKYNYASDTETTVNAVTTQFDAYVNALKAVEPKYTDSSIIDPTSDLESNGDAVSTDGIIYTHKGGEHYALYGQEISDNYTYGALGSSGERYTLLETQYPNYIDTSNPVSVYCLNDDEHVQQGFTYSDIKAVPITEDGKWVDEQGTLYNSERSIREAIENGHRIVKQYYLSGNVSSFFRYHDGAYTQSGVSLAITYKDLDGNRYGEYEFLYVMPNPAAAHTVIGSRNTGKESVMGITTFNYRGGILLFNRFVDSYGKATDIKSDVTWARNSDAQEGDWDSESTVTSSIHDTGTFKFASQFGNNESITADYTSPTKTRSYFYKYGADEGINSGAFAQVEHIGKDCKAYTASANVVDTDYYIDYSDPYNRLITRDADGNPTGYKFTLKSSNLFWNPAQDRNWGATSYMLLNGEAKEKLTTDSTYDPTIDTYSDGINSGGEGRNTYGNYTAQELAQMGITPENDFAKYYAMLESGVGTSSTNVNTDQNKLTNQKNDNDPSDVQNVANKYTLGLNDPMGGRAVMSGYLSDKQKYIEQYVSYSGDINDITAETVLSGSGQLTNGLKKAFPYIDSGHSANNAWNMHIDFTGKESVAKNTDTSTAEKYANFILEQGTLVYSWRTPGSRKSTAEETYAYFNIGVSTCDKGCVREFVDMYCNKVIKIDKDENGRITGLSTVDANNDGKPDEIASGNYSVASYREYLDALAEAYWFMQNPYNTTYKDENGESKEYTTAYGMAPNNEVHSLIYTDDIGDNIFGESGTSTDPVQAQIIQDILTAYENLFTKDDYIQAKKDWEEAKLYVQNISTDNMTPDTIAMWEDFKDNMADPNFTYYLNSDASDKVDDAEYWRYAILSGKEYNELKEAISYMEKSLMPKIDTTQLAGIVTDKTDTIKQGLVQTDDRGNETEYTYASWSGIKNEIDTANGYIEDTITPSTTTVDDVDYTFIPGVYKVQGYGQYTYNGKTYKYQIFDATDASDSNISSAQKNITKEETVLADKNLVTVDDADSYKAFDNALTVIESVKSNNEKYTDEGLAYINSLIDDLTGSNGKVYKTLTEDEKNIYSQITGQTLDAEKAKMTTLQETDAFTASLLTAVTTVNDISAGAEKVYVKKFKATLTEQDSNGSVIKVHNPKTAYYGEAFEFTVDNADETDAVAWSQTNYNGLSDDEFSDANLASATKIRGYNGHRISRIADTNVALTATITKGESDGTLSYRIEVYSIYNTLIGIYYTDSVPTSAANVLSINGYGDISAEDVPFYTVAAWSITAADENGVIKCIPNYSAVDTYSVTAFGGDISGKVQTSAKTDNQLTAVAEYDTRVTISADNSITDFYAWAVKSGDKYQIASYNSIYSFRACADEVYVPVVSTADGYAVMTYDESGNASTTLITADMIDSATTVSVSDADKFVQDKIKNKAPFISIEGTKFSEENKRVTAFVRITAGSDVNPTAYGIIYRVGKTVNADTMVIGGKNVGKVPIDNRLDSGQFVVSIKSSKAITNTISFRAYENYDYTYQFGGTNTDTSVSTTLNVLDYSDFVNAEPNV